MVIPAVMLAVLAFVGIRALMAVVAHDDAATPAPATREAARGVWADDARGFLLPAVSSSEPIDLARVEASRKANAS
jgi:hypothetical protein